MGPLIVSPLLGHHHRNAPDDPVVVAAYPIQESSRARSQRQHGAGIGDAGDPMFTGLVRMDHAVVAFHATQDPISANAYVGVLSFDEQQITSGENRARVRPGEPAPTLAVRSRVDVIGNARPRRLTPREWERLQGFPDDFTLIDGAEDSPRYEALGNSMAVPVMQWIGRRLLVVNELARKAA